MCNYSELLFIERQLRPLNLNFQIIMQRQTKAMATFQIPETVANVDVAGFS
jgi:F420-dependent methylenetetrahydromethanopterin dehydrogenase